MDNLNWSVFGWLATALLFPLLTSWVSFYLSGRREDKLRADQKKFDEEKERRVADSLREAIVANYRDPLLHAVADLQSRLYNILEKRFLETFLKSGSEREKDYAVENTIYVLAQFLGWTELTRQDLRFVALKDPEDTARLRRLQEVVNKTLTTDSIKAPFMIFSGEQRAIGEFMIHEVSGTRQVIGYGAFLSSDKTTLNQWLDPLRYELRNAAGNSKVLRDRLIPLQHTMIELMDLLDSDGVYFSKVERQKI